MVEDILKGEYHQENSTVLLFQGNLAISEIKIKVYVTYHTDKADDEKVNLISSPVVALSLSCKDGQVITLALYVLSFVALLKREIIITTIFTLCITNTTDQNGSEHIIQHDYSSV